MKSKKSLLEKVATAPLKLFQRKRQDKLGLPPGAFVFTGEKKLEELRIELTQYDEDFYEHLSITVDELPKILESPQNVIWIDITGLHDIKAMEYFSELFNINKLTMEDILDVDQRPKMEVVDDYLYTSVKMIQHPKSSQHIELEQVGFVLKPGVLVTFQEREGDVFSFVRRRLETSVGTIRKRGADYLLYALLDSVIDTYFVILEGVGQKIELLEDDAIQKPGDETLNAIYFQRKQLMGLRRALYPLREVVGAFQKFSSPHISDSIRPFVQDLHENTLQVIETLDSFRDMSNGVLDLCMNILSNKMNGIMKVLTVISTIFIPLSFVAGVYGMNFQYMPELQWTNGYFMILTGMGIAVLGMLSYFRMKKWF